MKTKAGCPQLSATAAIGDHSNFANPQTQKLGARVPITSLPLE